MRSLALLVPFLVRACDASRSDLDPAVQRRAGWGEDVKDAFVLDPREAVACPTDAGQLEMLTQYSGGKALDAEIYGCVPGLKAFFRSRSGIGAGESDATPTSSRLRRRSRTCADSVKIWGCIRGFDCRHVQSVLATSQCRQFECGSRSMEMQCSPLQEAAPGSEVAVDELIFDVEVADEAGADALGQLVADVGGQRQVDLFPHLGRGESATVAVNIADVFGGAVEVPLRTLSKLKLLYKPMRTSSLFAAVRMRVRHAGSGLFLRYSPIVTSTGMKNCETRLNPVWIGELPFGSWRAELSE
ncbi:hypothetical protein DCS_07188 [Drechmeria coniospora]|uniref:Uncharacterized protein n=1 Tax=Drechmeria coniospora TaxID=98403 RepID=A0A151GDR1_DRECN|nr:hypothetical protein DCS_07188 [Drechmeria coniospora]KYK55226.1 hypothetical protein DCS_07188 [Drechmeria coniospora]